MRALIGTPLIGKPKPWYFPTGGGLGGGPIGGLSLLKGEAQGLGVDFSVAAGPNTGFGSVAVKDTTTPGNNRNNVTASEFFTQSGTSPKLVLWSDGLYRWSPHNLALRSEDLTNATWGDTGTPIKTATTLQDDDASGAEAVSQSVTTIVGATYTLSVLIGKDAITTRFPEVFIAGSSNSIVTHVNTSTGAKADVAGSTGSSAISDEGANWRLSLTFVADSTGSTVALYPARATVLGTRSTAAVGTTTFTKVQVNRGTTPTAYHVTTSAAWFGVPIEYDPTTGKFYGLVEPAATNLALQSNNLANAAWTVVGTVTATANAALAPDGSTTATRVQIAAGAQNGNTIQQAVAMAASQTHTVCVFYKSNTGGNQTFALKLTQSTVLDHFSSDITATQVWQRASFAQLFGAGGTGNGTIGLVSDAAGSAADILVWMYQGEANTSVATSPIPTFAATVTRSADNINVATSAFPLGAAYTMYIDFKAIGYAAASNEALVALSDGSNGELSLLRSASGPNLSLFVNDNSSAQATMNSLGVPTAGVRQQLTGQFALNDFAGSANGAAATTDVSGTMPTPTTLYFAATFAGNSQFQEPLRINRFIIVPRGVGASLVPTWRYAP